MAMKYFEIEIIYKEIRVMSLPTNCNAHVVVKRCGDNFLLFPLNILQLKESLLR
jgi:hypothetical protein